MYPYISLGGTKTPTYCICAGVGLIAFSLVVCELLARKVLVQKYIGVVLLSFPGVLVGGKLFGILSTVLRQLYCGVTPVVTTHSGIVYYGGLLGYLLVLYIISKIRRHDFGELSNVVSIGIPLFHFFGRIGCFFAGCCYGIESKGWVAVPCKIYEQSLWKRRIPVQLIEAFYELCVFIILYWFYDYCENVKTIRKYSFLSIYLFLYASFRFIIEFWRGDAGRGVFWNVSFSQFISIAIIVSVLVKSSGGKNK